MGRTITNEQGMSTSGCIKFFEDNKADFDIFIKAKMKGHKKEIEYELTLTDLNNDEMIIVGGLTSGYGGEGPHGTIEVLKSAGFDFGNELVYNNISFEIEKDQPIN